MNAREQKFYTQYTKQGTTLIFHPRWFTFQNGDKYMPDFFCPDDGEFIEIAGTRQAFHSNKHKYKLLQEEYPDINFRVIHLDANGDIKPDKIPSPLEIYLTTNKLTQAEFGLQIGKSQAAVSTYLIGTTLPPRDTALKIVEITGGAVTLEDMWHTKIA